MMIRLWFTLAILCWVFLMWMALGLGATEMHSGHATYHNWYKHQMMPNHPELNCCDDKDCGPVKHRFHKGQPQMWISGRWVSPPKNIVQYKLTPDGGAHACYSRQREGGTGGEWLMWYCAIFPFMGG